jgi:hypothetical protein
VDAVSFLRSVASGERFGDRYAAVLIDGQAAWVTSKGYASVGDLRGMLAVPARAGRWGRVQAPLTVNVPVIPSCACPGTGHRYR